jgi:putative lipoic acid-binding regulatory protein
MTTPKATDIQNQDLWVFPMDYPIKMIGLAGDELLDAVRSILLTHVPAFDLSLLEINPSSGGKYHAIRAVLPLDSHAQVNALYADLAACAHIKTVL